MRRYRADWDLTSIPYEPLKAEFQRQARIRGGQAHGTPTDNPLVLEKRKKEAERLRKLRAKKKEESS